MKGAWTRAGWLALRLLLGAALVLVVRASPLPAEGDKERRTRAGARYFRSVLANDLDLKSRVDEQGRLVLVVYHSGRNDLVKRTVETIETEGGGRIQDRPVVVETTTDATLDAYSSRRIAGVFLADTPTASELDGLIRYGVEKHILLFSPFEGHVERGVAAGLLVEAQVYWYLNGKTIRASGINLKPIFLKVAKVLE